MNKVFTLSLMMGLSLITAGVYAEETTQPALAAAAETAAPIEVGNKICPVSGEKVGGMGEVVKEEHKGKIYNLCCAMCIKDFQKDPEKYTKIAEEEVNSSVSNTTQPES
jgi:YHS domain-containing protein